MAEQEPGRRDYNQSHWCVNLMDISPPPLSLSLSLSLYHTYTPPSFFLSFFLSLCFTAFHNIVFFFLPPFITKHPVRIFMSMSISPEIAFQLVCLWQHCTVLKSFSSLMDKTRIWGTVSHPSSQMRENQRGRLFLRFGRDSQFMRGLLLFFFFSTR